MLRCYYVISYVLALVLPFYWKRRAKRGKEDVMRKNERFGKAGIPRPKGHLVWIHAASVGESNSVIPLLKRIHDDLPQTHFLITTGTVSSAKTITKQLPERAFHQYVPMDAAPYVAKFLAHWQPDFALFVESEFWPNLLLEAKNYCPMVLINGRISEQSYFRWQRFRSSIRQLLECFSFIFPGSRDDARRFKNLDAANVEFLGNIKYDAPNLAADSKVTSEILAQMGSHRIWLAASTHPGEEAMIATVHTQLKETFPELMTIIVPRHNSRGDEITQMLQSLKLSVSQRSKQEHIVEETDIYLVDTMGELGIFYRLSGIAFIGGTLVPHGGHNPIEAARLDCAVVCGPHMENFSGIFSEFKDAHAILSVDTIDSLYTKVEWLLRDQEQQEALAKAAHDLVDEKQGVTDNIMQHIAPLLPSNDTSIKQQTEADNAPNENKQPAA